MFRWLNQTHARAANTLKNKVLVWKLKNPCTGYFGALAFCQGRTVSLCGDQTCNFICYPISEKLRAQGRFHCNWGFCTLRPHPGGMESWTSMAKLEELERMGANSFAGLSPLQMAERSDSIIGWALFDRDPLETFDFGNVTLLGDAAHPLLPYGSQGATQAIMDAEALGVCYQNAMQSGTGAALLGRVRRMTETPATVSIFSGSAARVESHKVEDPSGRVLITQRAAHMRTFPRCWVFPGGGVDEGELLFAAGRRELHEETGLTVDHESMQLLCFWESVFPTSADGCVDAGQVKGHSVTAFVKALVEPAAADTLALQSSECERCAWVPLSWLMELHGPSAFESRHSDLASDVPVLPGWQVVRKADGETEELDLARCRIEASQLQGIYPNAIGEGVHGCIKAYSDLRCEVTGKVVIANREMGSTAVLKVVDEQTQGMDLGAKRRWCAEHGPRLHDEVIQKYRASMPKSVRATKLASAASA
ncbi:phzS [Symbiodinium sp. CCMP2592]|nr:phzS [Symbiodinium sp. CCMP2592]